MAGKPKAPVPERKLAVTRPGGPQSSTGKHEGPNEAIKKWIAQGPKR